MLAPKHNKSSSSNFRTTASTLPQKSGFIEMRTVSYNPKRCNQTLTPILDQRNTLTSLATLWEPDTLERKNMETKYQWLSRPPPDKDHQRLRERYHSIASGIKQEELLSDHNIVKYN
jgi:hypothetical protein